MVVLLVSACNSASFVDSLEKQFNSIEGYEAEYTVIMNDTQFVVTEVYQNKGAYHKITVSGEGYQQEIELEGEKVKLKNTNYNEVIEGKRQNFHLPVFVLISVMEEIVNNKENIKIISETQLHVNDGELIVTHEGKTITKVEMALGGNEITVEYKTIELK